MLDLTIVLCVLIKTSSQWKGDHRRRSSYLGWHSGVRGWRKGTRQQGKYNRHLRNT